MVEQVTAFSYIRFSTPAQLKGTSLERQLEKTREYAAMKGWNLDESLNLQDLGISGFRGQNIDKGALGEFLKLVRAGKIPPKSVLIVENLDRITRGQPTTALNLFLEIIQSGVTIATVMDDTLYSEDLLNSEHGMGRLFQSILILSRGNEESRTKSKRLSKTWSIKRDRMNEKKLTSICPHWLKLNDNRVYFERIEERCALVEEIFQMCLDGKGAGMIAKEINMRGTEPWGTGKKRGKIWHKSYIRKVLTNPAVYGEYRPHKMEKGKRVPVGEPIEDYFPAVVDRETFYRVQEVMSSKGVKGGGRTGKVGNLFAHLAYCEHCQAPMNYVNKGKPPKGGTYLVCQKAQGGAGCSYRSIRYPAFEKGFLLYCADLNVSDLLENSNKTALAVEKLKGESAVIRGELEKLNHAVEILSEEVENQKDATLREHHNQRLLAKLKKKGELSDRLQAIGTEIDKLNASPGRVEDRLRDLQELIGKLDGNENNRDLRLALRAKLRAVVSKIAVEPRNGGALCKIWFKDRKKIQTLRIHRDGKTESRTLRVPRGLF